MIMLMIAPKTAFSQHLSISKIERDSIVSKIIRGNEAIAQTKVFKIQIKRKDSIISRYGDLYSTADNTIGMLKLVNSNLEDIIDQKGIIISNTKKRARKQTLGNIAKGVGAGLIAGFFLFK